MFVVLKRIISATPNLLISNLAAEIDTNDPKFNINVPLSTTTSKCNVNCGVGNITTTVVSCIGKKSEEPGKFRIDDSLQCTTTLNHTPCNGTDLDCPGTYNVIMHH